MAPQRPEELMLDDKWEKCVDLTLRRTFYSTLAGAACAVLFFRAPSSRWASLAFGTGVGVGSAYTDCSRIFDGHLPGSSPYLAAQSASASFPQD